MWYASRLLRLTLLQAYSEETAPGSDFLKQMLLHLFSRLQLLCRALDAVLHRAVCTIQVNLTCSRDQVHLRVQRKLGQRKRLAMQCMD